MTAPALSERECTVLEAVVRAYVETAEPAGSRSVVRRFHLKVSPATVRNTMSDLEDKGYLYHPHPSAGRIPTDLAYRFFVDRLIHPGRLTSGERRHLAHELDQAGSSAVERLVQRAVWALSFLTRELGVAAGPRLSEAVLEKLELLRVSDHKVLLVATIRNGLVRTVYVDVPVEVPRDTLVTLTVLLNERLAGLSLQEVRETIPERLRDVHTDDSVAGELVNIFMQSGSEMFAFPDLEGSSIQLGQTSVLASQPEFMDGERLKGLIQLTEQKETLASALGSREHRGGLTVTIGGEHGTAELTDFTLVTAEYSVGGMKGVIGVIGPTRMPYEKVIAIVDYTSSLMSRILS